MYVMADQTIKGIKQSQSKACMSKSTAGQIVCDLPSTQDDLKIEVCSGEPFPLNHSFYSLSPD
ncbi:hypothetical protein SADUNF_Sadunf14G0003700 [Salix dunnii]|uniref:Uncharacterized protein n=1 Tax=Salix dunnii TaxID=1413687 RepID=A0A835JH76_9ROSI|nr:hypothetical protein SADUNF_Sadunf14G0003700 [Salix dunnii]